MTEAAVKGRKPEAELRKGWTTGACAAAAAKAAFEALLSGRFADGVSIALPKGHTPHFELAEADLKDGYATAAVVKDAGDDPDITHGATVRATVRLLDEGGGIRWKAGPGVGTVTKAGLPLPVGEPAINPAPRRIIEDNLRDVADRFDHGLDIEVTISIPGGEILAEKTWNPRLGIVGGLSVLGTTGVVIPYSCSAWIHSIHRGIDVSRANGIAHVAGSTGDVSERAVRERYNLPDEALLDMGDFVGGMLKYLRKHPVPRLTIAGGFAKLTKLAQGHLDLHSSRSTVDFDKLAETARKAGADDETVAAVRKANTAKQALDLCGPALARLIARQAREVALATLSGETSVDILITDRDGAIVAEEGAA